MKQRLDLKKKVEIERELELKRMIACYAAIGLVFGAIHLGLGAPAAAVACSAGQSFCAKPCAASDVSSGGICLVM